MIVQPGKNCWRVERASHFYCIQDAADYFRLVRQALLNARKSVFSLSWDINAHVDLEPRAARGDGADGDSTTTRRRGSTSCWRTSRGDAHAFAATS